MPVNAVICCRSNKYEKEPLKEKYFSALKNLIETARIVEVVML